MTRRTKLIILNSPAQPDRRRADARRTSRRIADLAARARPLVLSDEIYGRILYDGRARLDRALPGMAERTIILDGFSKTYAMTGWRLGYAILPPRAGRRMSAGSSSTPSPARATFTQMAAVEALTGPQDAVDAMVEEFRARRDARRRRPERHPGRHAA